MQCSKSKGGRRELFNILRDISQHLGKEQADKLAEARSKVKSRFKERFRSSRLSALGLYDGGLYRPELKTAIVNDLEKRFDLLIMSGGYGLVRPDEVIYDYDINIAETASIWNQCLPGILVDYLGSRDISTVEGVFSPSAAYIRIAREVKNLLKAHGTAEFKIHTLEYGGRGAQRIVPKLQAKLLLELFAGKQPTHIDGVPVRTE